MVPSIVKRLARGLIWFTLPLGCASEKDATSKHLNDLSERVGRLQTINDRLEERVSALEAATRARNEKPMVQSRSTALPQDLPVVKMAPALETSNEPIPMSGDSDEPRTLIVGEGSRVEARKSDEVTGTSPSKRSKEKTVTEPSSKKSSGAADTGKKTP
jgi:hypothetical protein